MEPTSSPPEPLWTIRDLAALMGKSAHSIEQMRHAGYLPPAIKIGRRVYWHRATIDAWLASLTETVAS